MPRDRSVGRGPGAATRVVLDGTPLLGRRSGVGTYVQRLVEALSVNPRLDLRVSPVTLRSPGRPDLPPGVTWTHRPAPARLLRATWSRRDAPPVELFTGATDVYHGTNFVLPPTRRAATAVTVHDLAFLRLPDTVDRTSLAYRDLVPRAVRRADVVLTPSHAVADEVREAYGLDETVVATPLGVDPSWARARRLTRTEAERLSLPERYVVFVGTQEPRKDLATLVAAHRAATGTRRSEVPPLVLVGQRGWGDAADLRGTVRPGFLADGDLRSVVAGASALVMPSRYEGFGLPVLEALACGVPVVCSDLPVLREVAGDQATYAQVGDVDAFADALVATCSEDPEHGATSRRARAQRFSWQACAEITTDAYLRIRRR